MDDQNQQPQEPQSPIHSPGHVVAPGSNIPQSIPSDSPVMPSNFIAPGQPPNNLAPVVIGNQHQSPAGQAIVKKPRKSKLPLLAGLILLVLVLLGGGAYTLHINKHKTNTSTTTVNCGSENCFAAYFQKCTPATLTATSPIANVKYQIYGKKGSGCSTLFEYTSNPNAAWINQPMTCNFDNTQSLDNSVSSVMNDLFSKKNTYSCTGPLVKILQSQ